jgi:hypothetical protein
VKISERSYLNIASTAKNSLVGFPLFAAAFGTYLEIVLNDPLNPNDILFQ